MDDKRKGDIIGAMTQEELQKQLIELGFTDNEAAIYLILLANGLQTAGFLIKKTNFHRNVVYTALDKLIGKKLVSEFEQGGVKHYKTLDPERIVQRISGLKDKANEILPELLSLKKTQGAEVIIYENADGFRAAHEQVLLEMAEDETVYVMGVRSHFYDYMGENYKKLDRIRTKKSIRLKVLGFASAREELETPRPLMEIKYIAENFVSPVGTSVYGKNVLIQVYSEPTIVIRIKSEDVAKSYVAYFELLWKTNN